ncbi:MAG: DUF134 domain-containing protein [Bacteroidales bacterium]|nr:DUF134 domain-containing protein [Bacteroidales bacterium]NPV35693.1 DUF134 domain-containing protein [Bacteroidales bacterium]
MSPRIKIPRRVINAPVIQGFIPTTTPQEDISQEQVIIHLEEYEAIRLCDYEGLTQIEASECMGVSRPTFTRIYSQALRKVATAFVEGRPLHFMGGAGFFDTDWYHCQDCGCYFSSVTRPLPPDECPVCGSQQVKGLGEQFMMEDADNNLNTTCPKCGSRGSLERLKGNRPGHWCKKCGKKFPSNPKHEKL